MHFCGYLCAGGMSRRSFQTAEYEWSSGYPLSVRRKHYGFLSLVTAFITQGTHECMVIMGQWSVRRDRAGGCNQEGQKQMLRSE